MGQYSDPYVKLDVLIFVGVLQNFRDICMQTYVLDLAWYFTAPALTWAPC